MRAAASELTLEIDCLELCLRAVASKPSSLNNITKIPVALKAEL